MFLDTAFNTLPTVLSNVYSAFIESASKMYHYVHCLPLNKQPGVQLIIRKLALLFFLTSLRPDHRAGTIEDLVKLAFALIKSKERNGKNVGYKCVLNKMQIEWFVHLPSLVLSFLDFSFLSYLLNM